MKCETKTNTMDTDTQWEKRKWSVFIGFLTIVLFGIFGILTSAAANGNVIARWVLLIIFGAIAVVLASYALGYIILLIVGTPQKEEEPVTVPKPTRTSIEKEIKQKKTRKSKKRSRR